VLAVRRVRGGVLLDGGVKQGRFAILVT